MQYGRRFAQRSTRVWLSLLDDIFRERYLLGYLAILSVAGNSQIQCRHAQLDMFPYDSQWCSKKNMQEGQTFSDRASATTPEPRTRNARYISAGYPALIRSHIIELCTSNACVSSHLTTLRTNEPCLLSLSIIVYAFAKLRKRRSLCTP
jgi:hypothetical protein